MLLLVKNTEALTFFLQYDTCPRIKSGVKHKRKGREKENVITKQRLV